MVRSDNDHRQQEMDEHGYSRRRLLNVLIYVVIIGLYKVVDFTLIVLRLELHRSRV